VKIPKGTDIQVDTSNERIELRIVAAITTKAQAAELAAAIKQFASMLDGERRSRRPRPVETGAEAA
jgi:hypothetical protein